VSTIHDVTEKIGRTGTLVFVKVRHEIHRGDDPDIALTEFHDIVYREAAKPGETAREPKPAPSDPTTSKTVVPDPVLLFRFSALTFNGHRIHYDHPYATEVEKYPGLVVHGPLTATLLVDLLRREMPGVALRGYTFRALRPPSTPLRFPPAARPTRRAARRACGRAMPRAR
jgi:3-methylfumaryl-CoA hydratase